MNTQQLTRRYVIGVDFGTDSVRALLVETEKGKTIKESVKEYSRWKNRLYCDSDKSMFRQHPLDYIESIDACLRELLQNIKDEIKNNIKGISVATTGSTPCAVNEKGIPLALTPGFTEDPHAMFILWKDHTALREAREINELAEKWEVNYTKYSGGMYSSEWFWSKILYTLRASTDVAKNAYSWVELSDWIPALLTGCRHSMEIKRNRCAAGHKAMWHEEFEGLPSEDFLVKLDGRLEGVRSRLYQDTYTSDKMVGNLSDEWADKLGLSTNIIVGVGGIDAHFGAVGAHIKAHTMVKVVGTSTCDMVVLPQNEGGEKRIEGICGQVKGSILPDSLGLEAGQSAFGDLFDWFVQLLTYGSDFFKIEHSEQDLKSFLLKKLNDDVKQLAVKVDDPVILDWINGRRTPDVDFSLHSWITGINLATDAPKIFKALVEALAYGSRAIMTRFEEEGVPIFEVIATGGISKKSPFVMQTLADVLNRPIKVIKSDQSGAIGAAMFAAVASGIYATISEAQERMFAGIEQEYFPREEYIEIYNILYKRYEILGKLQEKINQRNT